MKIDKVVVGELETNCYILSIDNECLIIDPGDEYDKIINNIGNKKILGIIITHSHFDHIGALNYFKNIHIYNKHNLLEKEYIINKFKFNIIYTPGHKEDCITIYFQKEKVMFTGDFLFNSCIGRTDLVGGNPISMINSLNKIKKYPGATKIYPGHGCATTLEKEIV